MITTYMIRNGGILKVEYLHGNGKWRVVTEGGLVHLSDAGTMDTAIDSARKRFPGLK